MLMASYVWMVHFNYCITGVVTALMDDRSVKALTLQVVGNSATSDEGSVEADAANTIAEEHYEGCPLTSSPASAHSTHFSKSRLLAFRALMLKRSLKQVNLLTH